MLDEKALDAADNAMILSILLGADTYWRKDLAVAIRAYLAALPPVEPRPLEVR